MRTTTTTTEGCPMIARNYRRYPEVMKLQLELQFPRSRRRRPKEKPQSFGGLAARQRHLPPPRPIDAEDIPIGATIRTPLGQLAVVEGYRGFRRDHIIRLVCRYVDPENKRFDVVLLAPELVTVLEVA